MDPKVSIVVPVYNVEQYLDRCVQSLLNQTLKDIEIILVEDGSPDNCPVMCDEYSKQDKRVKVIHKQNAGLGNARNSGVELATGEYITFCDSDDWIDINAYEHVYEQCVLKDLDLCCFQFRRVSEDGINIIAENAVNARLFEGDKIRTDFMLGLVGYDPCKPDSQTYGMSSCMALFKREIFENLKARYPSEKEVASEDLIFLLNVVPFLSRIEILPNVYYNYRVNPASISQNFDKRKYQRLINMLEQIHEICSKHFTWEDYKNHYYTQQLRVFKIVLKFTSRDSLSLIKKIRLISNYTREPILRSLYNDPVCRRYNIFDRIFIHAMKLHCGFFFFMLYKLKK